MSAWIRSVAMVASTAFAAGSCPAAGVQAPNDTEPTRAAAMADLFSVFCLESFPREDAVDVAAKATNFTLFSGAAALALLPNKAGRAWSATTPDGAFTLTTEPPPRQICTLSGKLSQTDVTPAVFNLAVNTFVKQREIGTLTEPRVQDATLGGLKARVQVLTLTPTTGYPRQAFLNIQLTLADGLVETRMVRQFAPPLPGPRSGQ